ncbi:hypothetical protein IQ241_04525 [Romeria aff. gracilis LEGE 07310]|uniref:Ferritin n=1 Tax=Vasconcelosia minhoensis LEGE 07310 TaxID=915328 RepID=A0A8J7DKK0_9CYAN|nr:hypothetical protein [Romeria gracilis]MBE9076566.1 hypothetical protein [Romeria aff. gracilis LEGE 07310]
MALSASDVMSDLEYDWLSVLHNKAQAIQAYEIYIQDAKAAQSQPCVEMFEKLMEQEAAQIKEVRSHLMSVMQHGKM